MKFIKMFAKIFFVSFFCFFVSLFTVDEDYYFKKVDNSDYLIDIIYPEISNKLLLEYIFNYLNLKENEFLDFVQKNERIISSKYEFRNDYEIIDNAELLGVHLILYSYLGGAHHMREDQTYYFSKSQNKMVSLVDYLKDGNSLEELEKVSYEYVMKYSWENNLNFDNSWVREGLSSNLVNYEYFNFIADGLELKFPPYQVSCWADGEIRIVIPYICLDEIIKDEYLYCLRNNIYKYYKKELNNYGKFVL